MEALTIREYKTRDFKDITGAGYPFSTTMWGSPFKDLISKAFDISQLLKTKRLVVYSRNKGVAVGITTLKKISNNLWGIWGTFVSPAYRRRGISLLLYQASFDYLIKKGVGKAVTTVETTNTASIKSIKKIWDGFLSQKFFECRGNLPQPEKQNYRGVVISSYHPSDRNALFTLYKNCAHKDWYSFLEIDASNFLDRFIGYSWYRGLLGLLFNKQVLIAKGADATIKGYAFFSKPKLPMLRIDTATLHSCISPQLSPKEAVALVCKLLNTLFSQGFRKVHMFSINKNEKLLSEISNYLSANFGFQTSQSLVPIRKLKLT